jgi:hypothetical protein
MLYLIEMFKPLLYLSLLFFWACENRTENSNRQPSVSVRWQYLTLEFNDTVIQVVQSTDTLEVSTSKVGQLNYLIKRSEKDSLFSWSNELINFYGQPNSFCTDYVGKLKVRIRYNPQLFKEVSYSSICDWREINVNSNKIDGLLKKVTKAK